MANFTIMRSGLNTEIVGDLRIGQSSEDVTVGVTDDGTYQEYDKKLYYSYCYHNEVHRALCDINSNSEHIIPVQAFLEPGIVKLSLELSNGTNKPTCNACFIKVTKGAKSVAASVLPSEKTWQEYVDSYLAKARLSALNDIENQHALAVSEISKLGDDTTSTISTKSASALNDIENQHALAVSEISKLGDDTTSTISTKSASALNDIDSQREFAVSEISKLGDDTTSTISTKSASALNDIDSQREFAVSEINKIVNDTLSSVSAKAASAKKEIDEKASNTIASIPSDYATLTSKVSSLKLYRDNKGYLCEEE